MPKAIPSVILGSVLILSVLSLTGISNAYAKSEPAARPELTLDISLRQEGPQFKNGREVYETQYMTKEKLQMFYDDVGKVDRIFDTIILPVMNDFMKSHNKDIANKYTDSVHVSYSPQSGAIGISFLQYPAGYYETISIKPQPSDNLQMTDQFRLQFAVSEQFGPEETYENWLHYVLPNTSARIGYITNYMQKMIGKHENEIVNNYFLGINSFMLDDMSKTTIYLDRPRIVEYETGIEFVLANPISVYQMPEFSTNAPISIVKSSNYPVTVTCSSNGDVAKMTSSLHYPNGEEVSVDPTLIHDPAANYKVIEFTLKAEEPEGLYKLVLNDAQPTKRVYCHMNVNRGNDRSFEYVDSSTFSEPVLDRGWVAYPAETWCSYSSLMTVVSSDALIFDERTNDWIRIYDWLLQFGQLESTWSNQPQDEKPPPLLTVVKWRFDSLDGVHNALKGFNSLSPDMKKGKELSLYLIEGDCMSAEGREFGIETETSYIVRDIDFDQQAKKISYIVDTGERTRGLFKVTIPDELLSGDFTIVVDGNPHYVSESVSGGSNGTHTVLTYWHEGPARSIEVIGTEAIPEFPANLMAMTAIALLGIVAALRIRRTVLIS